MRFLETKIKANKIWKMANTMFEERGYVTNLDHHPNGKV